MPRFIYDIIPPEVRKRAAAAAQEVSKWIKFLRMFLKTSKYGIPLLIVLIVGLGTILVFAFVPPGEVVEIFSTEYKVESWFEESASEIDEVGWQDGENAFQRDVDEETSLAEFSSENSAILFEEPAESPKDIQAGPPQFEDLGGEIVVSESVEEELVSESKEQIIPHLPIIEDISVQREGGGTETGQTQADESGNWLYAHDKPMSRDSYKAYTIAIDKEGAQSYPSEEVNILVTLPPLFRIGSIVIDYIVTIFVLIVLIALMGFGAYWAWHRFRRFRKKLIKETEDVSRVLHRSFDLLKEDIEEQLAKLEKVKSKRELNKQEREIERQFKKDLDIAEKYIRKEIKDIEEKLK